MDSRRSPPVRLYDTAPIRLQKGILPGLEADPDTWLTFDEVKSNLAEYIKNIKRKPGRMRMDVEVSDSFFETAMYQIVRKDREKYVNKEMWLISENDTNYENLTKEKASYSFESTYRETSSFTLTTSKGHTLSLQAKAGGGFMGMNMGLTGGASYQKMKTAGEGQSHMDMKKSKVEIKVPPKTGVTVKELVYTTRWTAECHLYLLLCTCIKKPKVFDGLKSKDKDEFKSNDESEDTRIKYTIQGGKEGGDIKVSDLVKVRYLEDQPWTSKIGDKICIKVKSPCTFTKTERALETSYWQSSAQRWNRLMQSKPRPPVPQRN